MAGVPNLTNNRVAGTTSATQPALTAPNRAGGVGESYTYDAGGARLTRTHDGTTTRYFGLWEQDANGTARSFYSFGGQVVAQREKTNGAGSGTLVYLHGDHLGSASVVTDTGGNVLSQTEYGPWGTQRGNSTGTKPTTLDFTGQRKDGTGLLYYGARYYDPVLGRFLSADTWAPVMGSPRTLNRYAYAANNPLTHTDPTGHCVADENVNCDGHDPNDQNPPGGGGPPGGGPPSDDTESGDDTGSADGSGNSAEPVV